MKKIKLLSLFSGIGAFEKGLERLDINYEISATSEVDVHTIISYAAIHCNLKEYEHEFELEKDTELRREHLKSLLLLKNNKPLDVDSLRLVELNALYTACQLMNNLGNIKKIDARKLPKDIDMITHGSPCQSFSAAGRGKGGDRGSGTRSSLMWHTVDIVRHVRPKYVIWENVKGVLFKKHKHNFNLYLDTLKSYGYNNYYKVLNAKDYGIPQNRERVFVVSIRDDIDDKSFKFPTEFDNGLRLKHFLDNEVEEKYYINNKRANKLLKDLKERLSSQDINHCTKSTNIESSIKKKQNQLAQEPIIVASRGRNPDNPSSRKSGLPTKQRLEANSQGVCNTLTSVQKDNLLLEPSVLRYERTEYGKQIRKDYENGELDEKIDNMRELRPRRDGISNTLTTVQKDNLVLEPNELQFVGGIGDKDWAGDDKKLSRNYPQGNRVYSPNGIACSQVSNGGGTGGATGLYLESKTSKEKSPNEILQVNNPNHFSQRVYSKEGVSPTISAGNRGGGKEPCKVIEDNENKLKLFTNLSGEKWDKMQDVNKRVYKDNGLSPTISTCGGGHREPKVCTQYRIRKLTPLECWRLMGFDDEDYWIARRALEETYYNGRDRSNTKMYKMAGNSIVVNVLEEIFKNLFIKT